MPVLVLGAGCARGGDRVPGAGAGRRCWALAVRLVFLIFSNDNDPEHPILNRINIFD